MPVYDDDETSSFEEPRRSPRDWRDEDSLDEGPDVRDMVPDDFTTVRCTQCRKYIFEESIRCPYCKHLQLESEQNRKPLWHWIAVFLCILVLGGFTALALLGMLPWPTK